MNNFGQSKIILDDSIAMSILKEADRQGYSKALKAFGGSKPFTLSFYDNDKGGDPSEFFLIFKKLEVSYAKGIWNYAEEETLEDLAKVLANHN